MIGTFTQFAWTLFCLIWLTKVVEKLKNPKITKKTKCHAFFMYVYEDWHFDKLPKVVIIDGEF